MRTTPAVAAVDWGTTRFRLWLLARDGTVLAEERSDEGMTAAAREGFAPILERHLAAAGAPVDLPVVICGMAGSRQGWVEAGYIDVPADLARLADHSISVSGHSRPVAILPGIAQRGPIEPDVMRGEETQLLGAMLGRPGHDCFCMPGTHSKWVRLSGSRVTRFETFMTGEIYAALTTHTILAHSTGEGPVEASDPAFLTGVRDGWTRAASLTHQLFTIRAGQLLNGASEEDGRARLSGLLIGTEIAGAGIRGGETVSLVASGRMQRLYHAAIRECGAQVRDVDADFAVRRGLMEVWRQMQEQSDLRRPA